jgi:LPS export ABC transporter permease LptF/LPS export ABC transporter permease LptG
MRINSRLVQTYVIGAILPYVFLTAILLTSILFAQQVSRFVELLVSAYVPIALVGQITASLVPNVLIFTFPMAVLTGTIIGFSRLGSDSEIVAMRAAGVGTWKLLAPVLIIGLLASIPTAYISLNEAPLAARALRKTTLQAAISKLDSPVEPRTFNTEMPGSVVYIRDGDKKQGLWGRVFLVSQQSDGSTRLVTAKSGRIDVDRTGEQSELVLSDAVSANLSFDADKAIQSSYEVDQMAQLRVIFNTGRQSLLKRLREDDTEPDEMGWRELAHYPAKSEAEARDALTLMHKRLAMSVSPLVFALLGTGLGLRVRRGGRGAGALLSLITMVAYYLVSLAGEQMGRAGTVRPGIGAWFPTGLTVAFGLWLLIAKRTRGFFSRPPQADDPSGSTVFDPPGESPATGVKDPPPYSPSPNADRSKHKRLLDFPLLLDTSLLKSLGFSFIFVFISLVAIFQIFTLFELWRSIANNRNGLRLITEYLFYLLPFTCVQLLPVSVLLAILATYALMARRSEAIAWWASGQSAFRLSLPGLMFAAFAGLGLWVIQEGPMPASNIRQDALRSQIRGSVSRIISGTGRQWLSAAGSNRIYSYDYDDDTDALKSPIIYDFDNDGIHLQEVIVGQRAKWKGPDAMEIDGGQSFVFRPDSIQRIASDQILLSGVEPPGTFKPSIDKPSQLNALSLSSYIKAIKRRGIAANSLSVALQRKYSEPFSTLVLALIGVPLALGFGRQSAITALCFAVLVGVAFWAAAGGFQQLGGYGLLPPPVAAWAPTVIFGATGIYLLSRART